MIKHLRAKIERVRVKRTNRDGDVGSIKIDSELYEMAGLREYEIVTVVNTHNTARFDVYVLRGEVGARQVELSGIGMPADVGDIVTIFAYGYADEWEKPREVFIRDPMTYRDY